MFENMAIVQSAVSSFNNAALMAPAFLWGAILTLPLFVGAWICRNAIAERIGLGDAVSTRRWAMAWGMTLTLGWLIFMGGNYSVLRDAASTLPWMVAVTMFGAAIGFGGLTRAYNHLFMDGVNKRRGLMWRAAGVCLVLAAAVLGMPTPWGALMNVAAVVCGVIVGRRAPRLASSSILMMGLVILGTTLLLMQPEYFRFGQLGNLTPMHLLALVVTGALGAMAVILNLVRPRARIHHSAYIKLKWMARVIAGLTVVLFFLTESVPVFLGMCAAFGILGLLSVVHAERVPDGLGDMMAGLAMMAFGVITIMPAVGIFGLMILAKRSHECALGASRFLL